MAAKYKTKKCAQCKKNTYIIAKGRCKRCGYKRGRPKWLPRKKRGQ